MNNKDLIQVLSDEGNWFRYSKIIARELDILSSIALGNLIDKSSYFDTDYFFHTRDHIEFETGLNAHAQRKAEKLLQEHGFIEVTTGSHPTKLMRVNFYLINFDTIAEFLVEKKKTLKDKRREHDRFLEECRKDVQLLTTYTDSGQPDEPPVAYQVNGNKNILIRTEEYTTRDLNAEATSPTEARLDGFTIALDEEVIDAYIQHIDRHYIAQPADYKHLSKFKYKEKLIEYIPYWLAYIGKHEDYQYRGNTLDEYDEKNTAQIYVMIRHWNNFNKFAERKMIAKRQHEEAWQ